MQKFTQKRSIKGLYNITQYNDLLCRKEVNVLLSGFFYESIYLRKIRLSFKYDNDKLKMNSFHHYSSSVNYIGILMKKNP